MRVNRRYYKKAVSDVAIWALLLGSVIFMGVCPPIGFALVALVLFA